eukprot:5406600-Ditylum_brightwellii.AAC.1
MAPVTYYKALQVDENSTPEELTKAYERVILEFRSDSNEGKGQTSLEFRVFGLVYEFLLKDAKRKEAEVLKNQESKTYYEVLEIDPTATNQEIRKAYRRLALRYHPDHNKGDEQALKQFHAITQASEFLLDAKKRRDYDHELGKKNDSTKVNESTGQSEMPSRLERLALQYHPDLKGNEQAVAQFVAFFLNTSKREEFNFSKNNGCTKLNEPISLSKTSSRLGRLARQYHPDEFKQGHESFLDASEHKECDRDFSTNDRCTKLNERTSQSEIRSHSEGEAIRMPSLLPRDHNESYNKYHVKELETYVQLESILKKFMDKKKLP